MGFVSSHSTVSALIKVVDDCLQTIDKGYEMCMISFDERKAFDTVPQLPLLRTFEELGLNKYLLRWLKNYLLKGHLQKAEMEMEFEIGNWNGRQN